jgi:hypothetical protein
MTKKDLIEDYWRRIKIISEQLRRDDIDKFTENRLKIKYEIYRSFLHELENLD